jgi:hypothetical protein
MALVEADEAGNDKSRSGTELPATTNHDVPTAKKTKQAVMQRDEEDSSPTIPRSITKKIDRR